MEGDSNDKWYSRDDCKMVMILTIYATIITFKKRKKKKRGSGEGKKKNGSGKVVKKKKLCK